MFWNLRNSCFWGTHLTGCFFSYFGSARMFFFLNVCLRLRILLPSNLMVVFWVYSCLQTSIYYKLIFSFYKEILSNCVYKSFQPSLSIKAMVSWVFTFTKLLLTKSSFNIFTNWLSIQKQTSGVVLLEEFSVSGHRIYGGALIQRHDFNKVAYAA